nr:cyclase family protein [Pseudenhygromyxa sp. WMMC2535]
MSLALTEHTPVFPGDPRPRLRRVAEISRGDPLTVTRLELDCHVGTHVDCPAHFLAEGASLDAYGPGYFCGPARVLDLRDVPAGAQISAARIQAALGGRALAPGLHLLIATQNAARLVAGDFSKLVTLSPEAAEILAQARPRSVGFDHYSLDAADDLELRAHRVLAAAGVPTLVALDLSGVEDCAGEWVLLTSPLPLRGVEAAPVRALLCRPGALLELC